MNIENIISYPFSDKPMDKFYLWLAQRLPRRLVYWCAVRIGTSASTGTYANKPYPEITFFEVMKDWK